MLSLEALESSIFIIFTSLRIVREQCVCQVLLSASMALSCSDMIKTTVPLLSVLHA